MSVIQIYDTTASIYVFSTIPNALAYNSHSVEQTITPAVINAVYSVPAPTIVIINAVSVTITPSPVVAGYNALSPTVIANKDISVDFVGVPVAGSSPLAVIYTATVTFHTALFIVKEYRWYFDHANHPTVYETSLTNIITHVYTGYSGQKFTVKLEVILED